MRSVYDRWMAVLALVLVVGLSACAPKVLNVAPAKDTAAQPATATVQAPTSIAQTTGKAAVDAGISCDQLIPPDEAQTLMTGLSPQLTKQRAPGKTTCVWQYTSKVSGQTAELKLEAGFDAPAVEAWTAARKSELTGQPSDPNVISMDGLGDENYTWIAKPDNLRVVYVRRGAQTLVMHYQAADILSMATESGIIDMADRVFGRMAP